MAQPLHRISYRKNDLQRHFSRAGVCEPRHQHQNHFNKKFYFVIGNKLTKMFFNDEILIEGLEPLFLSHVRQYIFCRFYQGF